MSDGRTGIVVPHGVAKRSCYSQHFGQWCIESRFVSEAQAVLRSGGVEAMLAAAKENPPTEYTPAIYGLMGQFPSIEVSVPSAGHDELDGDADADFGPPPYFIFKGTAIIPVMGPITKYPSSTSTLFGGSVSTGMRKALAFALADEKVERILFAIDSPGGMAAGTGDLADDILAARSVKPIASHISDMGASAAYWIASQTSHISASRHAEVGSIGVLQVLEDASRAADGAGIEVLVFQSVPGKAKYVYGAEVTESQKKFFQDRVEDIHALFAGSVSRGRGADFSKKADGRFIMAAEALKQGFIDSIGNLRETLEAFTESTRAESTPDPPASSQWSTKMSKAMPDVSTMRASTDTEPSNTEAAPTPTRGFTVSDTPDKTEAAPQPTPAGGMSTEEAATFRAEMAAWKAEREAEKNAAAAAEKAKVASLRADISEEFGIDAARLAAFETSASLEAFADTLRVERRNANAGGPRGGSRGSSQGSGEDPEPAATFHAKLQSNMAKTAQNWEARLADRRPMAGELTVDGDA